MGKVLTIIIGLIFSLQTFASGSFVINGKQIKSQDDLQVQMAKQLNFPKFYTKKLDSLYDVLSTDFAGPTEIRIKNTSILRSKLGAEFTDSFVQTIMTAADENPKIILLLE